MKSYNNLPPEQHPVQRLVDQFNEDEQRWKDLKRKIERSIGKKKIDAVQLQRAIRAKLSETYGKSRKAELEDLPAKVGRLRKQRPPAGNRRGGFQTRP